MFLVGDVVVYPPYGAGLLIRIEDKIFNYDIKRYYVLKMAKDNMEIMIPVDYEEEKNLRLGIDNDGISEVYKIISEEIELPLKWSRRRWMYENALKKGDIKELAKLLKGIAYYSEKREIYRSEKIYFNEILEVIVSEVSLFKGLDIDLTKEFILNLVKPAFELIKK